ncbi:MAG: PD-(D/E)XK nuclease family protein [candidate division WOR-3 bacterium]
MLDFTYDELRHSRFIAYLLDPLATHAQGKLFFEIFLKKLNLPPDYAQDDNYRVQPEVQHAESRIDIEITHKRGCGRKFIIHIENKVGSMPDKSQIDKENRDLIKEAKSMEIPNENRHGFLLSPEDPGAEFFAGTVFKWLGWDTVAECLKDFINQAQAEKAKWMAGQYLECIEKNIIKAKREKEEVKNAEIERNRSISS